MSSDFDAQLDDPVIFLRKDAATTLVGFFFVTVMFFLVFYVIVVWDRGTVSAYNYNAWSYDGKRGKGPNHWNRIIEEKFDPPNHCGGKNQSPIWINTTNLPERQCPDKLRCKRPLSLRLINYNDPVDSGIIRVNHEQLIIANMTGNRFVLDPNGIVYKLQEIYFRFGKDTMETEHSLDNELFALEVQFVHYRLKDPLSTTASIVVLAAFFQVTSQTNTNLQNFLKIFGSYPQQFFHLRLANILPKKKHQVTISNASSHDLVVKSYITYQGSLTMPPCTENVRWYIILEPVEISLTQLRHIRLASSTNTEAGDNCRPLQPVNNRTIEIVRYNARTSRKNTRHKLC